MVRMMIRLTGVPPATPIMWVRFAALLLILLSLFYVSAARDCMRYRPVAVMTVLSRLAGVLFFSTQAGQQHPCSCHVGGLAYQFAVD